MKGIRTNEDIKEVVNEYFNKNELKDMMDYGASRDEGLGDISKIVADCITELGYPVDYNYAEDSIYGDGKYDVHIGFNNEDYCDTVKAWNGADEVIDFIQKIFE